MQLHAQGCITQRLQVGRLQACDALEVGHAAITHHAPRLCTHFGLGVRQQARHSQRVEEARPIGLGFAPDDDAQAPHSVYARQQRRGGIGGNLHELLAASAAARGEFQVRILAHATVRVAQQASQLVHRAQAHAFRKQALGLDHQRIEVRGLRGYAPQAAFAGLVPTSDPVADVQAAIAAKVAVRGQRAPSPTLDRPGCVARPIGLHAKRQHAAPLRCAHEVAQEEASSILVTLHESGRVQARAWIARQARRTIGDVGARRQHIRCLSGKVRQPQALVIPRTAQVRLLDPLVRLTPADLGGFDHMHPTRTVATVRVVVAGPQVAPIVEGQFLRIAQARGVDLEVAAVEVRAQHSARVRTVEQHAFLVDDLEAAIADRPIQQAIGAELNAVHVVAQQGHADAPTRALLRALIGLQIAVGVGELPHGRDAGVPDLTLVLEQACSNAIGSCAEAVRKDLVAVDLAVSVGVHEHLDALVLALKARELITQVLAEHGHAILDAARGEIVLQPVHVLADVGDTCVVAERLRHIHLAIARNPEADRMRQLRLGCEGLR